MTQSRNNRVALTFVASIATKITALVTMAISIPVALDNLGPERFGLWMTIGSLLAIMQYADLGIGNGLLNAISEAYAKNSRIYAQQMMTSAWVMLLIIGAVLLLLVAIIFPYINWASIFNVAPAISSDAAWSSGVLAVCVCLSLPLMTVQRVQAGYQEGAQVNLWQSVGHLLFLAMLGAAVVLKLSLPWFVLALAGAPVIAIALNWVYQFFCVRPWLFPRREYLNWISSRHIVSSGIIWALFQLVSFVGTGLDLIIVGHLFGQQAAAVYSVPLRLAAGFLIAQFISAPLWPAFAEAVMRGDVAWAERTFRRSLMLCGLIGLLGGSALFFFGQSLISLWLGNEEMIPSQSQLLGFASFYFISSIFSPLTAFMANNMLLRRLLGLTSIGAFLSFGLKFILAGLIGVEGVVFASAIGYGIVCIPGYLVIKTLLAEIHIDGGGAKPFGKHSRRPY